MRRTFSEPETKLDQESIDPTFAAVTDQEPERESTARFDRDELVRGWREYEARIPHVIPLVKYAAKTDMGQVRENNEDKFDFYEPEAPAILASRGSLFAVADGVGGSLAGQIASELMLKTLIASYYDSLCTEPRAALEEAVALANDKVHAVSEMIPERSGMGTTLTALVFVEDRAYVAQVGDSRAYLIRDGVGRQVTNDHSWVSEQVRVGLMTEEEAEQSPYRNVITRSIGSTARVNPDIFVEQSRVGDLWVLCSDGLTGHVSNEEIVRISVRHSPSEAARQLIELANSRGGRDNITVFVISLRDLYEIPASLAALHART
jgi:protein phosphatase